MYYLRTVCLCRYVFRCFVIYVVMCLLCVVMHVCVCVLSLCMSVFSHEFLDLCSYVVIYFMRSFRRCVYVVCPFYMSVVM